MNRRTVSLLIASCLLPASLAWADRWPAFAEQAKIGAKEVYLNGKGIRTATLFAVKVYEAAFYAPTSITQPEHAISAEGPLRLDIRYVRDFSLEDTVDAWKYQFRESSGFSPEDLKEELALLTSFQTAIRAGDVHRFDLDGTQTRFSINGIEKGKIEGEKFRKAFLTIFFGKNPPTRELQRALLKGRATLDEKLTSR